MTIRICVPMLSMLLAGCGGMSVSSLWPFDGDAQELSRTPVNAITYHCDGGKRFYVRYVDNGAYAWVILPEREFRLNKSDSAAGARYTNGKTTLDRNGDEVKLSDGPTANYTDCRIPVPVTASPNQSEKKP